MNYTSPAAQIDDLQHRINVLAGEIFDAEDAPAILRKAMAQHMNAMVVDLELLKLTEKLLA